MEERKDIEERKEGQPRERRRRERRSRGGGRGIGALRGEVTAGGATSGGSDGRPDCQDGGNGEGIKPRLRRGRENTA